MKNNGLQILAIAALVLGVGFILRGFRTQVEFVGAAQAGSGSTETTNIGDAKLDSDIKQTENATPAQSAEESTLAVSTDLSDSLAAQAGTKSISKNADVQWLLATERRHVSEWLLVASNSERARAHAGATVLIEVLSKCLSDATKCGADTSQWEPYYSMGGSQLHQALEQALLVEKTLSDMGDDRSKSIDKNLLISAQKVNHHNISFMATDLLLQNATSQNDFENLISSSRALQGEARTMYFEMADDMAKKNNWLNEQTDLHIELIQTLGTNLDAWNKGKLISNLDHFGLNESEFKQAVEKSCPDANTTNTGENLAERRLLTLEKQARHMGFKFNVRNFCAGTEIQDGV